MLVDMKKAPRGALFLLVFKDLFIFQLGNRSVLAKLFFVDILRPRHHDDDWTVFDHAVVEAYHILELGLSEAFSNFSAGIVIVTFPNPIPNNAGYAAESVVLTGS